MSSGRRYGTHATQNDKANAAGLLSAVAVQRRQQVIAEYQAELQRMRDERQANAAQRTQAESRQAVELEQAEKVQRTRELVAASREQGLNAISEAQGRELRAAAAHKAKAASNVKSPHH